MKMRAWVIHSTSHVQLHCARDHYVITGNYIFAHQRRMLNGTYLHSTMRSVQPYLSQSWLFTFGWVEIWRPSVGNNGRISCYVFLHFCFLCCHGWSNLFHTLQGYSPRFCAVFDHRVDKFSPPERGHMVLLKISSKTYRIFEKVLFKMCLEHCDFTNMFN